MLDPFYQRRLCFRGKADALFTPFHQLTSILTHLPRCSLLFTFLLCAMAQSHKRNASTELAREESTSPLIIFKSPGLQPDLRIKVFDSEFHVHSAVLRLRSAFFRRFLDSPDKIPAPAGAKFQYEYISVVDDDGAWGLQVLTLVRYFIGMNFLTAHNLHSMPTSCHC